MNSAISPLFISIYAGGMPFNGNTIPSGKSLGGSESAAYYMAKELAALGHTVSVFTSEKKCGTWDNVRYEWHGEITNAAPLGTRFMFAMKAPQDVVVIQRHPHAFLHSPNSKLNILWLHDLALHRSSTLYKDSLVNTDKIFTVSNFHRDQVAKVWGISRNHIYATKNGVDYKSVEEALDKRERKSSSYTHHLCFASRPERGLAELVDENGIMVDLKEYHLHVCGYNNTTAEMRNLYQYLYSRCEQLPNVTLHGHLGKVDLYRLLAKCNLYVYPTMFEDTSNILALEAAACGTPFLGMLNGALPETCESGFAMLLPPKNGEVDRNAFSTAIHDLCSGYNTDTYIKMSNAAIKTDQSWVNIAGEWDNTFHNLLVDKCQNKGMLIKHFEQYSDIVAMQKVMDDVDIEAVIPGYRKRYSFLLNNTFKEHYKAYYQYEKDRGVVYGPESLEGQPRFECISDIVKRAKPKSVLDYGCAHGHYTINLAKRMKDIHFVGVDIEGSNIKTATKWAKDIKIKNVSFKQGDHTFIEGHYDLIIAAEVLEHVKSPTAVVNKLMDQLNPGGVMVISVPYGPWEALGYDLHPEWRAHVHHLERADLKDMFGKFDDYKCLALPHSTDLGHYVLTFTKPKTGRCGGINYRRKLIRQAPRQSISACLIVKNEEDNISRCIKNIRDYVDEIIIGVDSSTDDSTVSIINRFYPKVKMFYIKPVLDIGFDAARNLTIERATSDWILWMDADETMENLHFLHKYLRPNSYNGYMVPQYHFSAEPAEILQTDYPCRIFRRSERVKFFGVVHEHPCFVDDINEGIGSVFKIPDVHVMHTGYATEAKRRDRFRRNFPLIKRDREKYPNRVLGQALYIRDLSHLIRYTKERNRGVVTSEAVEAAIELIELWQNLLHRPDEVQIRYLVDFLPYYSEGVQIISNGNGIHIEEVINGIKVRGLFPNTEVIRSFTKRVLDSTIHTFDEKYR